MDFLASAGALRLLAVRLSLTVTGPPSRRPRKYGTRRQWIPTRTA